MIEDVKVLLDNLIKGISLIKPDDKYSSDVIRDYTIKQIDAECHAECQEMVEKLLHKPPDDSTYCLGCLMLEAGASCAYDHCRLFGDRLEANSNGVKKCGKCLEFWRLLKGDEESNDHGDNPK